MCSWYFIPKRYIHTFPAFVRKRGRYKNIESPDSIATERIVPLPSTQKLSVRLINVKHNMNKILSTYIYMLYLFTKISVSVILFVFLILEIIVTLYLCVLDILSQSATYIPRCCTKERQTYKNAESSDNVATERIVSLPLHQYKNLVYCVQHVAPRNAWVRGGHAIGTKAA